MNERTNERTNEKVELIILWLLDCYYVCCMKLNKSLFKKSFVKAKILNEYKKEFTIKLICAFEMQLVK